MISAENCYGKEEYHAALDVLVAYESVSDANENWVAGELYGALVRLVAAYEHAVIHTENPRLDGIVAALRGTTAALTIRSSHKH